MESAGSALKRMLPELVVSKQKLRQAEGSCMRALEARGRKAERGIQFQTVCPMWAAGSEATEGPDAV